MDTFEFKPIHWRARSDLAPLSHLLVEEPLSIRVQGNPYAVIMRTPGDEIPLVAGFCHTEGIADTPDDIQTIGFCDGTDTNVVAVTLKPSRQHQIERILDRRGFISQTSCGICGKELVSDLRQLVGPLTDTVSLNIEAVYNALKDLQQHQPLRKKTRSAHGAVIYDKNFAPIARAEDVGRHNALDKAIGKLFLKRELNQAVLLTISSRISYELVQKAARARIPVMIALSRPTSLAVDLAQRLNITVGCHDKAEGLTVFCGAHRLGLTAP